MSTRKLTQRQRIWMDNVMSAIDVRHPDFRGSQEVKHILLSIDNYISAHVIPNLNSIMQDGGFRKHANGYWYKDDK